MTKEDITKKFLKDGEEILWSGTPDALRYLSRTDIFLIPVTLLLGGFMLSYAYSAFMLMLQGKSMAFALSGITILLISLYLMFGRIWYRHKRLSKNIYLVTSDRVFIFNTLRNTVTADIPHAEVYPEVFQKDLFLSYKNLGGDIVYGLGLDIFFRNLTSESPAFYAISEPQKVLKMIKKAKKGRKGNANATDFI